MVDGGGAGEGGGGGGGVGSFGCPCGEPDGCVVVCGCVAVVVDVDEDVLDVAAGITLTGCVGATWVVDATAVTDTVVAEPFRCRRRWGRTTGALPRKPGSVAAGPELTAGGGGAGRSTRRAGPEPGKRYATPRPVSPSAAASTANATMRLRRDPSTVAGLQNPAAASTASACSASSSVGAAGMNVRYRRLISCRSSRSGWQNSQPSRCCSTSSSSSPASSPSTKRESSGTTALQPAGRGERLGSVRPSWTRRRPRASDSVCATSSSVSPARDAISA